MVGLRAAIGKLEHVAERFTRSNLPSKTKMRSEAEATERMFSGAAELPKPEELRATCLRVQRLVKDRRNDEISDRDWRQIPWGLWLPQLELKNDPDVVRAYLDWIANKGRMKNYRSLIDAYVREFDSSDRLIRELANEIRNIVGKFEWVWEKRHKDVRLFDPEGAPARIAQVVLDDARTVDQALSNLGIDAEFITSGLGKESYRAALVLYAEWVARAENPERLLLKILDWAKADTGFRFANLRSEFAESLLMPWSESPAACPKGIQDQSRQILLTLLDDPRLHPGKWIDISESSTAVMRGWLTGLALRQYLEVVDGTAYVYQWRYRKAFWTAYFDKGYMSEAWVVFGPQGARRARQLFDDTTLYGRLDRRGTQDNHALLIMKIGGLTVADWSHNGKCHIWLPNSEHAPQLYKGLENLDRYMKHEVDYGSDNGGTIHAASANGTWQQRVESFIRENTSNVSLSRSDYMPRGG